METCCFLVLWSLLVAAALCLRPLQALDPWASSLQRSDDWNWSPWGEWSSCSVSCGDGIRTRSRTCTTSPHLLEGVPHPKFQHRRTLCHGGPVVQYQICKVQPCHQDYDMRSLQCAGYVNARNQSRHHTKTPWQRYLKGSNLCELVCQNTVTGKLRHWGKVMDGTPCSNSRQNVCLNGRCQAVGCDGIVGSSTKLNKCGLCDASGSTSCLRVEDSFTRGPTNKGGTFKYEKVAVFPSHASHLEIVDASDADTVTVLQDGAQVAYIPHGQKTPVRYQIAGTHLLFKPAERGGYRLESNKPLTDPLTFWKGARDQHLNITYRYWIPSSSARQGAKVSSSRETRIAEKRRGREHVEANQGLARTEKDHHVNREVAVKPLSNDAYYGYEVNEASGGRTATTARPLILQTLGPRRHRGRSSTPPPHSPDPRKVDKDDASRGGEASTTSAPFIRPRGARGDPRNNIIRTTGRKGKCRKCKVSRNLRKNFCKSDFVSRARIRSRELVPSSHLTMYRYEADVIASFKNGVPLKEVEFLWALASCSNRTGCRHRPLTPGVEYLLAGSVDETIIPGGREVHLILGNYQNRYNLRRETAALRMRSRGCEKKT